MALETLLAEPEMHVGCYRELITVTWHGKGTAEHMQRLSACKAAFRARHGDAKLVLITFILPASVQKPDKSMHAAIRADAEAMDPHLKAEAIVLTAEGFGAALIRGMVASAMLLTRSKHPTKVLPSVDDVCAWVAPFMEMAAWELRPILADDHRR